MSTPRVIAVLFAAACLFLLVMVVGSNRAVEAQTPEPVMLQNEIGTWQMFGANVAGTGGTDSYTVGSFSVPGQTGDAVYGRTYIYNTKTGSVYRVFTGCGDDQPNGCLVPLPVRE